MRQPIVRTRMTQRERDEFDQEKEMANMQVQYALRIKEMELEVAKLEAKWTSWLRLPMFVIMLPVRFLFGIGFIVICFMKKEPSDNFWKFIKG